MNGKVNAVTLGLANPFTKRQVEQATQGVVKSINGVTPNENGEIVSDYTFKASFLLFGSRIVCSKTPEEIYSALNSNNTCSPCFDIADVYDPDGIRYYCTKAWMPEVEDVNDSAWHLYFGDQIAPVIVNKFSDTIILDPDWVAPEPTATQSYVTQAIAPVQENVGNLESGKVSLPVTNSTPNYGTAGQFAVSDGNGGITWKTLVEAEGVDY